jgi:DNA replication protein DnaC
METKQGALNEKEINLIEAYFQFESRKKTFYKFSLGKTDKLKEVFIECFMRYDPGVSEGPSGFHWLKEYDEIIDWMADNKGKGLFMTGSPGTGKSNIILGVIVPVFKMVLQKDLIGIHASDLPHETTNKYSEEKSYIFDRFRQPKAFYIDELGTERMATWYGEKFEPFRTILDWAEQDYKVMVISSNLDGKIFRERYGERALDRLEHLCRFVIFNYKGKSLRPR